MAELTAASMEFKKTRHVISVLISLTVITVCVTISLWLVLGRSAKEVSTNDRTTLYEEAAIGFQVDPPTTLATTATTPSNRNSLGSLSTHVLDIAAGRPAANILISFYRLDGENETLLDQGRANSNGLIKDLGEGSHLTFGSYKIRFKTQEYFNQTGMFCFFPYADVVFTVRDPSEHYHIPLLLSPYGYSTYRGS